MILVARSSVILLLTLALPARADEAARPEGALVIVNHSDQPVVEVEVIASVDSRALSQVSLKRGDERTWTLPWGQYRVQVHVGAPGSTRTLALEAVQVSEGETVCVVGDDLRVAPARGQGTLEIHLGLARARSVVERWGSEWSIFARPTTSDGWSPPDLIRAKGNAKPGDPDGWLALPAGRYHVVAVPTSMKGPPTRRVTLVRVVAGSRARFELPAATFDELAPREARSRQPSPAPEGGGAPSVVHRCSKCRAAVHAEATVCAACGVRLRSQSTDLGLMIVAGLAIIAGLLQMAAKAATTRIRSWLARWSASRSGSNR